MTPDEAAALLRDVLTSHSAHPDTIELYCGEIDKNGDDVIEAIRVLLDERDEEEHLLDDDDESEEEDEEWQELL